MAKVVNRLFLVALCGVSVLCGAYVAKSAPQVEGQVVTTEVKHAPTREIVSAPTREVASAPTKGFTHAGSESRYSSNLVYVAEHVELIESIPQGNSAKREPVVQRNR